MTHADPPTRPNKTGQSGPLGPVGPVGPLGPAGGDVRTRRAGPALAERDARVAESAVSAASVTPADAVSTRSAAGAALNSLPTSRRELLEVIKRAGEADIDLLSRRLGITASGARQHLTALERDGLVSHRQERTGPGRPRHLFALTPAADALFPRNYVDLTNELLEYVEEADPALLAEIFDKRGRRRLERAQTRLAGRAFPEQVAEIARILDEDGYLADFVANDDGSYLLREHNCAVLGVALRYGHACSSELDFLQDALPTATVTRVAHRIAGGHICAYEVRPKG